MQESIVSNFVLPLIVALNIGALGMTLTIADFQRVLAQPKSVLIGLFCQVVLLPVLGFVVAEAFDLLPVYAVSLILTAASPDAAVSNLIIHAGDGDRALGITLTAITNMLAWLSIPLALNITYSIHGSGSVNVEYPVLDTMMRVALITILPTLIGMGIRSGYPGFAERSKRWSKILATVFISLITTVLIIQNWRVIATDGPRFAPAIIMLNIASVIGGYFIARLAGIKYVQAVSIAIATGMQNPTIAIAIAVTFLNNSEMAIIPGLYAIWMYVTGFVLAYWMSRWSPQLARD